mmetsp:Transcript_7192/g.15600  ORF Transcript_7192/g.15600 Transcript_7192/m.15600 type:complete len:199 (-) Transcript_7192:95-691(-)
MLGRPATQLAWLCACLVLLGVPGARAYASGRARQVSCPMDFDVPLPNGRPSRLHLASVANFLEPKVQDAWWTEPRVEEYFRPSDAYVIGRSRIAGCGIIAARHIKAGEQIGLVWVKDPATAKAGSWAELLPRHFTPWYGRAVNHCSHANSQLRQDSDGEVFSVALRNIERGEEVTGDYNEASRQFPLLVEKAPSGWSC